MHMTSLYKTGDFPHAKMTIWLSRATYSLEQGGRKEKGEIDLKRQERYILPGYLDYLILARNWVLQNILIMLS